MEKKLLKEEEFEKFIAKYEEKCRGWRREFHKFPELGWTEYRTTYRIVEILGNIGYATYLGKEVLASSYRMGLPSDEEQEMAVLKARQNGVPEEALQLMQDGHTGLVAVLDTKREGPHIALRFDIDALPIKECDEAGHYPEDMGFKSVYKGVMHACGHDGHTAIGLTVAHFISEFQDQLSGKFTLLFQPAEEGSRGAKAMVEKGWLDDVDFFLSGHIGCAAFEIGEVAASTEGFFATTKLDVVFQGKSAHAGVEPQTGKNALLAGAAAALQLHSIPRHSEGSTRLNVGKMIAGSGRNIIPDKSYLEIETRGETNELNLYMLREAKRIIEAAALAYDVEASIKVVGEGIEAPCDPQLTQLIQTVCARSSRITKLKESARIGASEDVCYMLERVQKCGGQASYMLFGSPLSNGHHHPAFDYKEDVLTIAVDAFSRVIHYLAVKN